MLNIGDKVRVKNHKDVASKFYGKIVTIVGIHCNHNPVLYSCITDRKQGIALFEDEIESI